MNRKINRRDFFVKTTGICVSGCALLMANNLQSFAGNMDIKSTEPIDPKALNYCGYKCPADCAFLKGSVENNLELKKKAYVDWKIKEHYNIEFEADKIFCFGCKNTTKPEGVVLTNCTVRKCAQEKKIDSCVECNELKDCNKDLWKRFPDFKKTVIQMQKNYKEKK